MTDVRISDMQTKYLALPALLTVAEIQERLGQIFPASFPDRNLLVGVMAARVIFVFLYGGFVEGSDRYLRPSYIYLFTEEQSEKTTDFERLAWGVEANRSGFRPDGKRWYADTSREPIRDDLIRNQLVRLGIVNKLAGQAPTSSKPIYYLSASFAALFFGRIGESQIEDWRENNLDNASLQRMLLRAEGIHAKVGDVFVDMPDGQRIRLTAGLSSLIAKGLIEEFAKLHLVAPAVLWLSASDKKSDPEFKSRAAAVGLNFDLSGDLPDLVLVDTAVSGRFIFCEIVATDGAVTAKRREALLELVRASNIPESEIRFLSAFDDRQSSAFKKNVSQLAVDSWVWFRTEPHLLVILTTNSKASRDERIRNLEMS